MELLSQDIVISKSKNSLKNESNWYLKMDLRWISQWTIKQSFVMKRTQLESILESFYLTEIHLLKLANISSQELTTQWITNHIKTNTLLVKNTTSKSIHSKKENICLFKCTVLNNRLIQVSLVFSIQRKVKFFTKSNDNKNSVTQF